MKYMDLNGAKAYLNNLLDLFAQKTHSHNITEIVGGGSNLQVLTKTSDGAEWADVPSEIPMVTSDDNGKFLRVVDGSPQWQTVDNAEEVSF